MKCVLAGGTCTAAILAFGMAAYAQTTGQTPSQPAGQPSSQPTAQAQSEQASEQQTLTGCVQSEADYRRARSAGQGGAAGTGVGAGNEFVLINASTSSESAATGASTSAPGTAAGAPSTSGSATAGTAGTSGASAMKAFELTGSGEGQLRQYVGKRVEITGRLKSGQHSGQHSASGTSTSGTSTSGTSTSGTSTSGTATGTQSGTGTGATRSASDPMAQDLNLPEFEVASVREASGSCPAAPSQR